jgi:acyl dehydratase
MNAFDRIAIGEVHAFGSHLFTAEEIKRFAVAFDPQAFHLDEDAAKASIFGGLCASGWHTASAMMRLLVDHFAGLAERAKAAGEPVLTLGPSPGFEQLKWQRPVYAGDTITFTCLILGKRTSRSRPGWGILSLETTGVNADGEPVFAVTAHVFVRAEDDPA